MHASSIPRWTAAALIVFIGLLPLPATADEIDVVGVWRLASYLRQTPSSGAEFIREFGDNSGGVLMYTEGGHMSVLLKAAALVTYAGRFTVSDDKIIHHVEVSNISEFIGQDLERSVKISGNRMTLKAKSKFSGNLLTLVWQRIEQDPTCAGVRGVDH